MRSDIRSYDYVNHSYATVRQTLVADPAAVFRAATRAAAERARSVAAQLRVSIAGVDLAADIAVSVGEITDEATGPAGGPTTRIPIYWEAADHPRLFPLMDAVLSLYPLTATETQLDLQGRYEPPLGLVGAAVDALVLHRLAEASVHRFTADVAAYLRDQLTKTGT
jgi:hypothetical protein